MQNTDHNLNNFQDEDSHTEVQDNDWTPSRRDKKVKLERDGPVGRRYSDPSGSSGESGELSRKGPVSSAASGAVGGSCSSGKRGRRSKKSNRVDVKAKLERSRQSARECRARKKLRYQYLEDLVNKREKAVFSLRKELDLYKEWCRQVDEGADPEEALKALEAEKELQCYKH